MKILIIPCLLLCAGLQAQPVHRSDIIRTVATPGSASGLQSLWSSFSVRSSLSSGANARAEIKHTSTRWTTWGIFVEQKLSKGSSEASPLDLIDGLATGARAGVSLQRMYWSPILSAGDFDAFDQAANQYARRTGTDRRMVTAQDIRTSGTAAEQTLLCARANTSPVFFSAQAWLEKNSYTYTTDSVTLRGHEKNVITPGVTLSLIQPNISRYRYWVINYQYAEGYRVHEPSVFQLPFGTSGNSITKTAIFGEPTWRSAHKFSVEYRKAFGPPGEWVVAINPSLQWSSSNDRATLHMPVYFIPGVDNHDKPKGLQGGLALSYAAFNTATSHWTNLADGFSAQVFITAPFDLLRMN